MVHSLRRETQEATRQIKTLSKAMSLAISDYGAFNFEKILELRKEPSIEAFRKAISHISSELTEPLKKKSILKSLKKSLKNLDERGTK